MDYISKRKNNIQSISIYCRPHQGLREEQPFCELPHISGAQTGPLSAEEPHRGRSIHRRAVHESNTSSCYTDPAIRCPLLQTLYRNTRKLIYGPHHRLHNSKVCCSPSGLSLLSPQKRRRAVWPLLNLKTDHSSWPV